MKKRFAIPGVLIALALPVWMAASHVLSLPQFGGKLDGVQLERAHHNPQYHDGKFVNVIPQAAYRWAEIWQMADEQLFGTETRVPPKAIPVVPVTPAAIEAIPATPGLHAFWIGHASVFIALDGVRILVDPIFSDYASPFEMGPKRFHPPPIALADLPMIDAVVITHDHYDHLDMRTVQRLAGNGTQFLVPLGIGAHLKAWGVPDSQVRELEWWQEATVKGVRFVSTPARHYSGRGLGDKNATLWTSWSVLGAQHRFYVSGDTGYSDHFSTIGNKLGPFDLAFIKIGAYGPSDSWHDIHMGAEEAVQASADVHAKRMFPVHWATFNLAFHDWDEPVKRTLAAARARNVEVLTPRVGEVVDAGLPFASTTWWEAVR